MVRLTDRPDMTLDVYHGRKTTTQHNNKQTSSDRNRLEFYNQSSAECK